MVPKKKTLQLKGCHTLRNHISLLHEDLFYSLGQESSWQPCSASELCRVFLATDNLPEHTTLKDTGSCSSVATGLTTAPV